eukprot:COSAG01_NODE_3486_length_6017_cov_8.866509_8_plen_62_part_00
MDAAPNQPLMARQSEADVHEVAQAAQGACARACVRATGLSRAGAHKGCGSPPSVYADDMMA